MDAGAQIQSSYMVYGHVFLAVCAVFYLLWWWIFFRPDAPKLEGAAFYGGAAVIVVAALFGIAAIGMICVSLSAYGSCGAVSGWLINVGAVIAYIALMLLTKKVFDRPVTTELLLIVGWAALELNVLNTLFGAGVLSAGSAIALLVLVAVLFAASMVCYVLYFNLGPLASFIDGAVPLAVVGVVSVAFAVLIGA